MPRWAPGARICVVTTPYTPVAGRSAILSAYGRDPFLSCFVSDDAEAIVTDDAMVWCRQFNGGKVMMAHGDAGSAAELITEVVHDLRPDRVTLPRQIFHRLPDPLRPETVGRWHWFFTLQAPEVQAAEEHCGWFDETDYPVINSLLDSAFPDASSRPTLDDRGHRWFGARDDSGHIVACGTVMVRDNAGPMLGSVAVAGHARRQGLGSAITAWITRQLLHEGHPQVALGSMAGEHATHRMYQRLGFRDTQQLVSGRLPIAPLR